MFTYFCRCDLSVAISRLMFLSLVAVLPFVGGCGEDDNPIVDEHDHEEEAPFHIDADGFVLEVEGVEVYRQFQGTQTGSLTVGVDEEVEVHVEFLDANRAEIHISEAESDEHGHDEHGHGETEEAFSFSLTNYDANVIDIHLSEEGEKHAEEAHEHEEHGHEHEEHGEEDARWRFEVIGLKAGTTQITLQLLHGDHPDFTAALPIPVTVQ